MAHMDIEFPTTTLRLIAISLLHIGVGMGIVAISSFLNSEMAFSGWTSDIISIYLGLPILFELTRIYFSHLFDSRGYLRRSLIFGSVISSIGLVFVSNNITPVPNLSIIIFVSLFYAGTSILTTLVDANMTSNVPFGKKSDVAGIIQVMRLVGFALGGIVGSLLYQKLEFQLFFVIIAIILSLSSTISIIFIFPQNGSNTENKRFSQSLKDLKNILNQPIPLLMMLFLFFYPIGLFMQDLILEPFAIQMLSFEKNDVGKVVTIWTSLTLFFVPLGVITEKKTRRDYPIVIGHLFSIFGLLIIGLCVLFPSVIMLYCGVVLFGIGNGIGSAPAISVMLDVASIYPNSMAMIIGIFGLLSTIGRSSAALLGGLILNFTSQNYILLFSIEALFVFIGLLPLLALLKKLQKLSDSSEKIDTNKIELQGLFQNI